MMDECDEDGRSGSARVRAGGPMAGFISMEAGGTVVGGEGNELPKPVTGALEPVTQKERKHETKTNKNYEMFSTFKITVGGEPHQSCSFQSGIWRERRTKTLLFKLGN